VFTLQLEAYDTNTTLRRAKAQNNLAEAAALQKHNEVM
jgi:hypothetical protein